MTEEPKEADEVGTDEETAAKIVISKYLGTVVHLFLSAPAVTG